MTGPAEQDGRPPVPDGLADVVGLLREVGDLKRVRVGGRAGSIADDAFGRGWSRLVAGEPVERVAAAETAAHVAACRLAGLDAGRLAALGVPGAEAAEVLREAVGQVSDGLDRATAEALADAVDPVPAAAAAPAPPFVAQLVDQPRAGATCPGRPRLVLLPAESHGDHCLTVAVYGWLLARRCDADPADAWLLGLGHHLHNAALPDSGYTGEVLLGDRLLPLLGRLTEAALADLPEPLAARLREVLAHRERTDGPLARTFAAADVLDRVLQQESYERAARSTLGDALVDLELVHAGPVQRFQDDVLAAAGVWPR